jgi:hypothetical protein
VERKAVSVLAMMLLLVVILASAFNVQPAQASENTRVSPDTDVNQLSASVGADAAMNGVEMEIAYDDGAYDDIIWWSETGGVYAVRFTPSVSGQLEKCSFYTITRALGPVKIHVMNSEKTDLVDPFVYDVTFVDWIDVDLSAYDVYVSSGVDFYLGLEWTMASAPRLGFDTSDPDGRSWEWSPSTEEWALNEVGDLMIRATVLEGEDTAERYALLISGGVDLASNFICYKNDLSFIYDTLVNYYRFDEDHVITVYFDGSSQDLDGDGDNDVDYAATKANVNTAFNTIKASLDANDLFFIFVTDHGTQYESPEAEDDDGIDEGICLWDSNGDGLHLDEVILDNELAALASGTPGTLVFLFTQCFSGGFIDDLSASNRIIMTSCLEEGESHGFYINSLGYDYFAYHWTVALQGFSADANGNGQISMQEAFDYAVANDEVYTPVEYESEETETCQIDDPSGIAETTTLGDRTRVSLFPVADAFVNSEQPDNNFGGEDHLSADITTGTSKYYNYTYIMFDLSLLPADAVVESADLNLLVWNFAYRVYSPGPKIYVHYCSDNSWTEFGITWNNKPAFDIAATSYVDPPVWRVYNIWDVTEDALSAVSSGKLTEVLMWPDQTQSDAYAWIDFRSREEFYYEPLSQILRGFKPKLIVDYSIEVPPVTSDGYLLARGTDNSVWYRVFDGAVWGDWRNIPGTTSFDPSAAVFDGKLYVAAISDSNNIWMCNVDLTTQVLGDWVLWPGTSASSVLLSSSQNELCLVARGTDDRIWYRVFDGAVWGDWHNISGTTSCDPAAYFVESTLYVAAICPSNHIWMCSVDLDSEAISDWVLWSGTSASSITLRCSV